MRRTLSTARRILLWLAMAGLLLAGGWQSHAHELTDHHAGEFAVGHDDQVPHAHFGADPQSSGYDVGLVVHCGADILPLSNAPEFIVPASVGGHWCGMDLHPSSLHYGRDPPPPRILR